MPEKQPGTALSVTPLKTKIMLIESVAELQTGKACRSRINGHTTKISCIDARYSQNEAENPEQFSLEPPVV
jgi:hypothetical protein